MQRFVSGPPAANLWGPPSSTGHLAVVVRALASASSAGVGQASQSGLRHCLPLHLAAPAPRRIFSSSSSSTSAVPDDEEENMSSLAEAGWVNTTLLNTPSLGLEAFGEGAVGSGNPSSTADGSSLSPSSASAAIPAAAQRWLNRRRLRSQRSRAQMEQERLQRGDQRSFEFDARDAGIGTRRHRRRSRFRPAGAAFAHAKVDLSSLTEEQLMVFEEANVAISRAWEIYHLWYTAASSSSSSSSEGGFAASSSRRRGAADGGVAIASQSNIGSMAQSSKEDPLLLTPSELAELRNLHLKAHADALHSLRKVKVADRLSYAATLLANLTGGNWRERGVGSHPLLPCFRSDPDTGEKYLFMDVASSYALDLALNSFKKPTTDSKGEGEKNGYLRHFGALAGTDEASFLIVAARFCRNASTLPLSIRRNIHESVQFAFPVIEDALKLCEQACDDRELLAILLGSEAALNTTRNSGWGVGPLMMSSSGLVADSSGTTAAAASVAASTAEERLSTGALVNRSSSSASPSLFSLREIIRMLNWVWLFGADKKTVWKALSVRTFEGDELDPKKAVLSPQYRRLFLWGVEVLLDKAVQTGELTFAKLVEEQDAAEEMMMLAEQQRLADKEQKRLAEEENERLANEANAANASGEPRMFFPGRLAPEWEQQQQESDESGYGEEQRSRKPKLKTSLELEDSDGGAQWDNAAGNQSFYRPHQGRHYLDLTGPFAPLKPIEAVAKTVAMMARAVKERQGEASAAAAMIPPVFSEAVCADIVRALQLINQQRVRHRQQHLDRVQRRQQQRRQEKLMTIRGERGERLSAHETLSSAAASAASTPSNGGGGLEEQAAATRLQEETETDDAVEEVEEEENAAAELWRLTREDTDPARYLIMALSSCCGVAGGTVEAKPTTVSFFSSCPPQIFRSVSGPVPNSLVEALVGSLDAPFLRRETLTANPYLENHVKRQFIASVGSLARAVLVTNSAATGMSAAAPVLSPAAVGTLANTLAPIALELVAEDLGPKVVVAADPPETVEHPLTQQGGGAAAGGASALQVELVNERERVGHRRDMADGDRDRDGDELPLPPYQPLISRAEMDGVPAAMLLLTHLGSIADLARLSFFSRRNSSSSSSREAGSNNDDSSSHRAVTIDGPGSGFGGGSGAVAALTVSSRSASASPEVPLDSAALAERVLVGIAGRATEILQKRCAPRLEPASFRAADNDLSTFLPSPFGSLLPAYLENLKQASPSSSPTAAAATAVVVPWSGPYLCAAVSGRVLSDYIATDRACFERRVYSSSSASSSSSSSTLGDVRWTPAQLQQFVENAQELARLHSTVQQQQTATTTTTTPSDPSHPLATKPIFHQQQKTAPITTSAATAAMHHHHRDVEKLQAERLSSLAQVSSYLHFAPPLPLLLSSSMIPATAASGSGSDRSIAATSAQLEAEVATLAQQAARSLATVDSLLGSWGQSPAKRSSSNSKSVKADLPLPLPTAPPRRTAAAEPSLQHHKSERQASPRSASSPPAVEPIGAAATTTATAATTTTTTAPAKKSKEEHRKVKVAAAATTSTVTINNSNNIEHQRELQRAQARVVKMTARAAAAAARAVFANRKAALVAPSGGGVVTTLSASPSTMRKATSPLTPAAAFSLSSWKQQSKPQQNVVADLEEPLKPLPAPAVAAAVSAASSAPGPSFPAPFDIIVEGQALTRAINAMSMSSSPASPRDPSVKLDRLAQRIIAKLGSSSSLPALPAAFDESDDAEVKRRTAALCSSFLLEVCESLHRLQLSEAALGIDEDDEGSAATTTKLALSLPIAVACSTLKNRGIPLPPFPIFPLPAGFSRPSKPKNGATDNNGGGAAPIVGTGIYHLRKALKLGKAKAAAAADAAAAPSSATALPLVTVFSHAIFALRDMQGEKSASKGGTKNNGNAGHTTTSDKAKNKAKIVEPEAEVFTFGELGEAAPSAATVSRQAAGAFSSSSIDAGMVPGARRRERAAQWKSGAVEAKREETRRKQQQKKASAALR